MWSQSASTTSIWIALPTNDSYSHLSCEMCCPDDQSACWDTDRYLGHRTMAQAFENYISSTPALQCRSSANGGAPPQPLELLDLYIARVIHASQVPETVPFAALYLLASISQSCNCGGLHDDDDTDADRPSPSPSRLSHVLSRALTRTSFSRMVSKFHWNGKHIFMGAFFVALLTYKSTLSEEEAKELHCWEILPDVSGISGEELGSIAAGFQRCVSSRLQTAIEKMLGDGYLRDVAEVVCPFEIASRRRRSKMVENRKEKSQKRRVSLKRSVSSFWKSPEKTTLVAKESDIAESLDFRSYSPSPNSSYSET